jgi:hypothetical protein
VSDVIERYLNLIEGTLRSALQSQPRVDEADGTISMTRGLTFARLVIDAQWEGDAPAEPMRMRDSSVSVVAHPHSSAGASPSRPAIRVVDGAGHSRSMYAGLLAYAFSQCGVVRQEKSSEASTRLLARRSLPAADARDIVGELWSSLTEPRGRDAVVHFASMQRPSGEWFARTDADNPEPLWYHELVALHAVTSAQARLTDIDLRNSIDRSARYIAAEVQPDHASSQPWAIHALLGVPDGVYLADMMLHAAGVQQPATMDAVSLILLADALDCLRGIDQRK